MPVCSFEAYEQAVLHLDSVGEVRPGLVACLEELVGRNSAGNAGRGVCRDGFVSRVLLSLEEGVDATGDGGHALGECPDFCGVAKGVASNCKSDSELRLFFLGGPVGIKLGCSPIVVNPGKIDGGTTGTVSRLPVLWDPA